MNWRFVHLAVFAVALAGGAATAYSAWDETQLQLLRQYSTPLRWYNVEGAPYWVAGVKPHFHFGPGPAGHFIQLRPGEEITLRAPAHSWLRLAGQTKLLGPDDLEISVSSDARGFITAVPIKTIDPYSLLLAMSQEKPAVIRISRPRPAGSKIIFAAWISVEQPLGTLAPYRKKIHWSGRSVSIRRDDEAGWESASLVKPPEGINFPVEGPARVELVARLPWPRDDPPHEQAVVIQSWIDGADAPPLLFYPELDARHRTRVNRATELVSLRMNGYINVPGGKHILRLQPTVAVYLSAYLQDYPDYLLSAPNAPATSAREALRSALKAVPDDPAFSFEFPAALLDVHTFVALEQSAWRLARDNNRLDAGAQAADWLNRIAQTRRDYPAASRTVSALWRQRTFYRELLPARQPGDQPLRQLAFFPVNLRELFEPERAVAVYNPTLEQVEAAIVDGRFASLPATQLTPLLYELPHRSYDSELRIAAIASPRTRTQFFIQFDQEKPVKIALEANAVLPADEFEPSAASATLRVLQQETRLPSNRPTMPIGEFDLPFPLSEPAIVEWPLPQHVRQVRIYQETAAPVEVSIAYRAAKPFELGETGYLALLNDSKFEGVSQLWSVLQDPDPKAPAAVRELHNHFLPLIRLLKAHRADFAKSVDSNSSALKGGAILSAEEVSALKISAATLEKDGQPIEALEIWNRLFWQGTPATRAEAALLVMHGLEALGEDFLAAQYARYALLTAPRGQIPAEAIALLENNARQADDSEQLEQLRAVLFLHCPCPEHLAGLVEAFALNSRDEMVLTMGLILPAGNRPNELMLASALHVNWWKTFDQLVDGLPQSDAKCFWRAQKELALGHFTDAERSLTQAGERGAEMLRALQEGGRIRPQLAAADLKTRLNALFAWEQWQRHQPGPRTWRDAEDVAIQCSAAELVFNSEQNQFAQYFRAERDQRVTLRFVGPLRLQIEARPVLGLPFEKPVDDWLEISEHGITNRVPVFQAVPNPSLQLTSTNNAVAGVKTTADLEWGPGLHEIEVGLAGRTGLIRILQEQPVLPTRILPALNIDRLNRVLGTGRKPAASPQPGRARKEDGIWWVSPEMARLKPRASADARDLPKSPVPTNGLTDLQTLRLALRIDAGPEAAPNFSAADLQALPPGEQWLAACRWKRWNDFTNWTALTEVEHANYLLATHRVREVLESNAPRDIRERLSTLLRVAEEAPASRKEAQYLAEQLAAAATNCPPGCRNFLIRLSQDLSWTPLPISPSSAGIRPVQVRSDLPQDPSSRTRRALLPPTGTNEFTVAAQSAFAASMTLQHAAQLQVRTELVKAGFSPPAPLTVSLQIDALDVQRFPLSPLESIAGTNFTLPEGPHAVRIWIEDPVVNQFVRVSFSGHADGATNSIWSKSLTDAATESRFFHAATAAQPIRFSWKGPALLRLDEWRDGRFLSELRLIQPGEQTVEIRPAPGRNESWYRIFVRATETNQTPVRPALAAREPDDVPAPKLKLPDSIPPSQAELKDYYRPGGQEDGTWTADFAVARRLPFEMDARQGRIVNEFAEANATYRKQTPGETLWFATEALFRAHRPGDLTIGLAERIEGRPQVSLFDWAWTGEGFAGTAGPQREDLQAALHTAFEIGPRYDLGRKLEDHPFVGAFAHYLTIDPARAFTYNYVDQDLFTHFRYKHRWGWMAGNELEYRPWLDTVLRGYVDAASNENLTPDHWGARVAWNQLIGPLRGEVGYRFTHYLADDDRTSATYRQGISAGLFAEHWFNGRHRVELGIQYRHEWPNSGDSYFLVLRWDFSRGRGYRDYGPEETLFRDLRSRRIPPAFNNHFQPGPSGATLP